MFPIFCSSNTLFPHASVVGENTQQRLGWHIAGTPTGAKNSINEAIAAVIESGGRTATQVAVNIANATNSSLQVSEQVESNLKLINDVYLNTLAIGIDTFTQAQLNVLYYLALQCPLAGGNPVYRARGMLSAIIDTTYNDTKLCSDDGYSYKKERTPKPKANKTSIKQQQFYLQPNPAKDVVTILSSWDITEEVRLQLIDYTGKSVLQNTIHFTDRKYTLPISSFSAGVYLLRLQTASGETSVHKLNIE